MSNRAKTRLTYEESILLLQHDVPIFSVFRSIIYRIEPSLEADNRVRGTNIVTNEIASFNMSDACNYSSISDVFENHNNLFTVSYNTALKTIKFYEGLQEKYPERFI